MSQIKNFVVDTNTLISSLLIKNSTSYRAIEKVKQHGRLVFSDNTFLELERVLFRNKFDKYFSIDERLQIIGRFHDEAYFVEITVDFKYSRDPNDDMFLQLAVDAGASCIITGDLDLLVLHPFRNIPILSSADFLNRF